MSGGNPSDGFEALCHELGVTAEQLAANKDLLRRNTDEAIARGVFGVPTFVADGEIFWGADSLDFLKAFLQDPAEVRNDEMRRIDSLPVAAARKA
jgi:2-hydroxychromene-2-carboxylate isomerase